MKTRNILTTLGAVTLAGTALSAVPAQAEPLDLQVESVKFDRASVAVSSLNTVPVTITVKATYKLGVANQSMYVELNSHDSKRTDGTQVFSEPLKLISGTGKDGTWEGKVNVPSTADGRLDVDGVYAGVLNRSLKAKTPDNDPVTGVSLAVNGLNIPKITRKLSVSPVPFGKSYSITWQVLNSTTGKPYGSRLKVLHPKGDACLEAKGSAGALLTNAAGVIVTQHAPAEADKLNCLLIPGTQAPIDHHIQLVPRPGVVAATPDKTSAKVGTTVSVKGNVAGITYGCTVNLQKLSGATAWRTLRSAKLSVSSRYTLPAAITAKGKGTYRVQFPKCDNTLAGVSRSFTITGV
ncbi:hypothetical protein GCM10009745_66360 [Kribbella yunnanensis]|uniref:Ig-like domain-containing protein n=1 Tax=Kribbella yunnanensis TaxID=190194 RepID=A0ABN2IPI4_9ACTN